MIPIKVGQIKREQWILLLLLGILIMVAAMPFGEKEMQKSSLAAAGIEEQTEETKKRAETAEYEKKLETLLSQMDGAGEVKVMITEAVSRETVVEKDKPYTIQMSQNGEEADAVNKTQQETREETTVFQKDQNGKEYPYVTRTLAPKMEGVLVLAQGGDNAVVARNITEAVMALFGIEAHKIKVMKMI